MHRLRCSGIFIIFELLLKLLNFPHKFPSCFFSAFNVILKFSGRDDTQYLFNILLPFDKKGKIWYTKRKLLIHYKIYDWKNKNKMLSGRRIEPMSSAYIYVINMACREIDKTLNFSRLSILTTHSLPSGENLEWTSFMHGTSNWQSQLESSSIN